MGLDPGVHSGYCILESVDKRIFPVEAAVVEGHLPMCEKIVSGLARWSPDIVVCELFRLAPYMSTQVSAHDPDLSSSQLQGFVRYIVLPEHLVLVPANMKSAVPDEELKKLGLWKWEKTEIISAAENKSRLSVHVHDAMRHAVYYLWRNA